MKRSTLTRHYCSEQVTAQLLFQAGADPMSKDEFGCTPAHCAATSGSLDVFQLLEKKGADTYHKSHENKTPSEVVEQNNQTSVDYFTQVCLVTSKVYCLIRRRRFF